MTFTQASENGCCYLLCKIQKRLGSTMIMIAHNMDESTLLSDRIVIITNGPAARIGEIL